MKHVSQNVYFLKDVICACLAVVNVKYFPDLSRGRISIFLKMSNYSFAWVHDSGFMKRAEVAFFVHNLWSLVEVFNVTYSERHAITVFLSSCLSTGVGRAGCFAEKHPHFSKAGIHSSQHHWHLQKPDSSGFYQVGNDCMEAPPTFPSI